MRTGFVWHELYMWHQNDPTAAALVPASLTVQPGEFVENPETKRRFKNLLDASGLTRKLVDVEPRRATDEDLLRVHTAEYIARMDGLNATGGSAGPVSQFGPDGFEIIRLAAGGALAAVDAIFEGRVDNAYALLRPCGHHALPDSGMGFCILNNGALAARYAKKKYGVERVAFVDWDVHHGNGTQGVFWEDPNVLTISIHQAGCFPPDQGWVDEIGEGAGEFSNINIPLPPGSGFGAYREAMERVIAPALRAFRPDFIIVPCGFDAGGFDPLARQMLSSEAFRFLTDRMLQLAAELCSHRMLFTHEGGYHAPTVAYMGLAVVEALSGIKTSFNDPFNESVERSWGQDLQPHQAVEIEKSRKVFEDASVRWASLDKRK
jgi:acetoin utilization deacetylase AcuC-like enzyme